MNVSKGDLAYISECAIKGNIGRAVQVIKWMPPIDVPLGTWLCETNCETFAFDHAFDNTIVSVPSGEHVRYADFQLRRIAGPSIDITESNKEPIRETA